MSEERRQTQTGGKDAVDGWIAGDLALSVGPPKSPSPDGFEWRRLTDLARLESGHTPSRNNSEYWDDGDIPWITVKEAAAHHGETIFETEEYITALGEQNSSARLLPANTVCLTRTGSLGFVVVMGRPMTTSQGLVNWVCGPNLDWRYLKYILLGESDSYHRFSWGSAHQTIYFPEVKAFHVLVPRIEVQLRIADILGALDDKIESNRRMNGLVDGLVRSEFQRLAQTSTCESVYVGDVINRVHEAVDPSALAPSTPYIGLEHMPRGSMFIDRWANADGLDSGKSQFEISDVLFGKLRPNFRKVGIAPISGICSTDILVLRPKSGFSVALVLAIATSEEVLGPAIAASSGTKMPRVSWDYISKLQVSVPDASGCAQFANVIGPMIQRTMRALLENRILENTRDALLPELLSGRLRVRDAEKVVADSV